MKAFRKTIAPAIALVIFFAALNFNHFSERLAFWIAREDIAAGSRALASFTKGAPNRMTIPALGVSAPLIYIEERSESAFQRALRDGVVHYPGTALPGQPGNAYFFGHSSDFPWAPGEYKTVFATLPDIANGDEIVVSGEDGTKFVYVVRETKVVASNDTSVLAQDRTEDRLTVQTSYPVGTALARFIVIADLK